MLIERRAAGMDKFINMHKYLNMQGFVTSVVPGVMLEVPDNDLDNDLDNINALNETLTNALLALISDRAEMFKGIGIKDSDDLVKKYSQLCQLFEYANHDMTSDAARTFADTVFGIMNKK